MKSIDTAQVLVNHLPSTLVSSEIKPFIYNAYVALEAGHLCIDIDAPEIHFEENHPLYRVERFEDGFKFYLEKFWTIENTIFSKLQELISVGNQLLDQRKAFLNQHQSFISSELFGEYDPGASTTMVDWQKIASLNAFLHNFAIITGGPGTGKTTTVAKLLYLLFLEAGDTSLRVELVSQTGKAAARLKESLMASTTDADYGIGHLDSNILNHFADIHPETIHRLLGSKSNSLEFEYNKNNLLPADVIIVDEASMADAPLLSKLMEATKPGVRFYLLGDKNQLSSVEIGSVFSDLCLAKLDAVNDLSITTEGDFFKSLLSENERAHFLESDKENVASAFIDEIVELKRSYRFSDTQQIGVLAYDLIQKQDFKAEDLDDYFGDNAKEVQFLEHNSNLNSIYLIFEEYIHETDIKTALDRLNKVKILTALRRDAIAYNALVEQYLVNKNLLSSNNTFYHNQPIMVTSNDYFTGLYNGDVGLIRKNENGELRAYFEFSTSDGKGKEVKSFSPAGIQSFETAFAITIHKSQGSEFDTVLMVLPKQNGERILSKELVYTGLTRAKKQAYILSSKETFIDAVNQPVSRISGIGNRIAQQRRV
jgi:exodeoxyribonuclease V alpha subunit